MVIVVVKLHIVSDRARNSFPFNMCRAWSVKLACVVKVLVTLRIQPIEARIGTYSCVKKIPNEYLIQSFVNNLIINFFVYFIF